MKLLVANYRYFVSSGPERYMFNLMPHLQRMGHECIPFSVRYSQNLPSRYADHFVPPIAGSDEVYFHQHALSPGAALRTFSRLFYSPQVRRAAEAIVRHASPDAALVLQYLRKMSPSLVVGLKRAGIPVVARLSDYAMLCPGAHLLLDRKPCMRCLEGSILPSIANRCVKDSLAISIGNALATWFHRRRGYFGLIDHFVTPSRFMRDLMVKAGYPEDKISHIPTFVDCETFSPGTGVMPRRSIVFVGRIAPYKGLDVLIRAYALIRSAHPRPRLTLEIAGTGQENHILELENLAARCGLDDESVRFLGHVPTEGLPELYRRGLVCVQPSICFENLPNTLLESLACGTPVVASDLGSMPECVRPGETGFLFQPGDPQDLARVLEAFLADDGLTETMSPRCRATALESFSPQAHIQQLLDILHDLLEQRTP